MKVIIEYLDHEAKHRSCVADVDMDAPAVKRDAVVASIVALRSPDFIKVRRYYREPEGRRGKL